MSKEIIIIGADSAGKTTCLELIKQGHDVAIVEEVKAANKSYAITARKVDLELVELSDTYHQDKPKPKHHNKKYNNVNRKKNKASRKARKQNKRRHK
jgi:2-polyprenyl-6-methoxyphenol hydroxylase-like FAD-dependent oxidoreductase